MRIVELCVDFGGSITGEHGVGIEKVCSMPKMFTGDDLTAFDRVRSAFDPAGLCNPGKLLPTPRLCGEVPGFYHAHPVETAGLGERM
jgi:glycolate oxidase